MIRCFHSRPQTRGMGAVLGALTVAVLAIGCAKGDTSTPSETPALPVAAGCPERPDVDSNIPLGIWPDDDTQDLVPSFDELCATPTSPDLFFLLNESAGWGNALRAAALGVLHRGKEAIATFSVSRVSETAIDEIKGALQSEGTTSEAGDTTLIWARGGSHTMVFWIDDGEVVFLSAASEREAIDATSEWLDASGTDVNVAPPEEIPEQIKIPPALEAGPPLKNLPRGYTALVIDPLSFLASDFADEITIFENKNVSAIGAAIILADDESKLIGTVVGREGSPGDMSQGISDFKTRISKASEGAADGFIVGQIDVLVVGFDGNDVEAFTRAWERAAS
jgi:hypothetical protein